MADKHICIVKPPESLVADYEALADGTDVDARGLMALVFQHAVLNKALYDSGAAKPLGNNYKLLTSDLNVSATPDLKQQLRDWAADSKTKTKLKNLFVLRRYLSLKMTVADLKQALS